MTERKEKIRKGIIITISIVAIILIGLIVLFSIKDNSIGKALNLETKLEIQLPKGIIHGNDGRVDDEEQNDDKNDGLDEDQPDNSDNSDIKNQPQNTNNNSAVDGKKPSNSNNLPNTSDKVNPEEQPNKPAQPDIPDIPNIPEKPIEVTVSINNKISTYGDPLMALDFTIVNGNVDEKELKKDIILSKANGKEVGMYQISGTCTNTKKWNVTFQNGTYTIVQREVTVEIDNKSSVYGERLESLTSRIVSGTAVNGDNLGIVLTKAEGKDAKEYTITGTSSNRNYNVTFINGKYTIHKRDITIKLEDKTSYKDEPLVNLTYQILSGNTVEGDNINNIFSISTSANNSEIGEYTITGIAVNNNYNFAFQNGVYKIKAKAGNPFDQKEPSDSDKNTPGVPKDPSETP